MMVFFIAAFAHAQQESQQREIADIAINAQGSIYVLDHARDEVLLLDKDGKLVKKGSLAGIDGAQSNSWQLVQLTSPVVVAAISSNGLGVRDVTDPEAIRSIFPPVAAHTDRVLGMDGRGRVYYPNKEMNRVERYKVGDETPSVISDPGIGVKDDVVVTCDLAIDGKVDGPAHFAGPHRVDVDGLGNIWILDQSYTENVFDSNGKFLRGIKAPDPKNRSFTYIVGMESDKAGNTYLACQETRSVLKYDKDGKLAKTINTKIWARAFGLDGDGKLYLADAFYQTPDYKRVPAIKVFDQSGNLVRVIIVQ